MGKKEKYEQTLHKNFEEFLKTGNEANLRDYLISNSNLPGPRGNLELAEAFAEVVEDYSQKEPRKLWKLCMKLTEISPVEAPANNPKEFLVFCGTRGIGALGSSSTFFQKALSRLKELASDSRWRTREAVAMAVQRLIEKHGQKTLNELESWIEKDNWLVMRAVAAGVAEPVLLIDKQTARFALELHKKVFAKILAARVRKPEGFKALKQGLGYSLSVVVRAIPREGFEYMHQIVDLHDEDIRWIIKENLKKNRLIKNFPAEVASIKKLLNDK
jgi:hypothetical protein